MKNLHGAGLKLSSRIFAIAACTVLVCGLSVGAYAYMAPVSYVSMDVNPSIEYSLNRFDRVLSAQAVNEDGAKVLQEAENFKNKPIDEVIQLTLKELSKEGYFDGNTTGGVVIATSGKESASVELLATRLKEVAAAQCAENNHTVSVEAIAVDQVQMDEAKALGVTPGKLLLVQNLQAENRSGETILTEEWLQKSVREIMAETERLDDLNDALEDAEEDAADALEDEADALAEAEEDAADALEDEADALAEAEEDAADALEDEADALAEAEEDAAEAKKDAEEDAKEAAEKKAEAIKEAADKERDAADKARDLAEEAKEAAADAAEEAAEAAEADSADADNDAEDNDSAAEDTE